MCSFKSALCLRDRVFVPDYDSHEDMLKELGIQDDYLNASKTFVRVELSPANGDKSSDPMGWKLKVDQDIRPEWFDPEVYELRIKQAIADWCAVHVIKDGKREVKDGIWYATGGATVRAYDSATVRACGNATVILLKHFQTDKPVILSGEAVCVNHKTHTIRSAIKWTVETEEAST